MTRKFRRMLEKKEKKETKEKQFLNNLFKNFFGRPHIQRHLDLSDEEYQHKCLLQHDSLKNAIDNVATKINVSYFDLFSFIKKCLQHEIPENIFLHEYDAFDVNLSETRQIFIEARKTVSSIAKIINKDYKTTAFLLQDAYEYDWFEKYGDDISVISSFIYSNKEIDDKPNPEISSILVNFHDKFKEYDNNIKNKDNFSLGNLCEQFISVYVQSLYSLECSEALNIPYEDAVEKTLIIQSSFKEYITNELVDGDNWLIEGAEHFFEIFKSYNQEISGLLDVQVTV